MRAALLALLIVLSVYAQTWNAMNFPNPTAGQFKQCGMRTTANICDPDGVLTEQTRYRLDHDLKQLETRTRQDRAHSFCDKKGVTAAMAIAKRVEGGSKDAVRAMANDMLQRWTLDEQCQKAVVIVVSTEDKKFWVARDDKVPVYAAEFDEIFNQQKDAFRKGDYQRALGGILSSTWEKALSKQGSPQTPSGGRGSGGAGGFGGKTSFGDGGGRGNSGGGAAPGGGSGMKMPSIPKWFWLALIGIVIPLLCCGLCCWCCCCRGKGGSARVPTDPSGETGGGGMGGGARGGGGGGRGGGLLSSLGGAGVGSLIGNFLSKRGRGSSGGGGGGADPSFGMGGMGGRPAYQGGGAYPAEPQPAYDDNQGRGGKGLYPSAAVKDQGGGGGW